MVLTARLYDIPKLEQCSVEFMAFRIEDIVSDPKFRQLVTQDAECIKDRQATDTIDIIDEIRFLLRTQGSVSDIWDTKNQLEILDNMLEDLGFETYNWNFLVSIFCDLHTHVKQAQREQSMSSKLEC